MGGRFWYGPGYGFFGGLLWVAIFAAFIGLVAWAVYALIRHEQRMAGPAGPMGPLGPYPPGPPGAGPGLRGPFPPGPPPPGSPLPGWGIHHDDALNAARVRYARGEIDREQYFRVVEDLTGVPRPQGSAPYGAPPPPVPTASPAPAPGGHPTAAPAFPPGPPLPRPEWNQGSTPGWPPPTPPGGGRLEGSTPGAPDPASGPASLPTEAGGPEA